MSTSHLNRLGAINFSPHIKVLMEGFTGREWLFTELDNWLDLENGEKFYLLTGEPGIGKSAIAAMLTKRKGWVYEEDKPLEGHLAAYHFFRAGYMETVRPNRVLRSLATQLGNTLPHYGEALDKVLGPVYTDIKSKIDIGTLGYNSYVTSIHIENLKDLDPEKEFQLLIQDPLAALSEIYKEPGNIPPKLKVFLIDSLDEAATTTGETTMVTLLASLYQARATLPSWVRFLLTSRPDQAVLDHFPQLEPKKIGGEENLGDIQDYIQGRIDNQLPWEPPTPESQANAAFVTNLKPLQQRLDEAVLTPGQLVDKVKELSHGNFLYTKLLLNSIASGEQSIKNLDALPKTLNDIYHRILRYRCSFRVWSERYQPILGTLCVTQQPISQEQLVKFIKITTKELRTEELRKDLDIFRQFLDESEDEEGQICFTIFHQSLREYLLNKKHNHDFWCDAKEQHENIIQCFEKESSGWQNLRTIDVYGLRHLAQHIVQGKQQEKLHDLLNRKANGRNAWFDAKRLGNDILGFLTDVTLAWKSAEQEFSDAQSSQSIVRQCRYALITSSINSLSEELPTALVMELVRRDSPEGWAYFRQMVSRKNLDLEILSKLEFREASELKPPKLVEKLLKEVEKKSSESYQIRVKCALARYYTSELPNLLNSVNKIENENDKNQALRMLIPYFSWDSTQLSKILEIAKVLPHKVMTQILGILPKYISESKELSKSESNKLLGEILTRLQNFGNGYDRVDVLSGLTPYLPDQLLQKALDFELGDQASTNPEYLCLVLKALAAAPSLNQVYEEKIKDKAKSLERPYFEIILVLCALLLRLPDRLDKDQLDNILQEIQTLEDEDQKAEVLSELASQLPTHLSYKILQAVQETFKDESYKAKVLSKLVPTLPSKQLNKILQTLRDFQHDVSKAEVLIKLAINPNLTPCLINEIQEQVKAFQNTNKNRVISAFVTHLPKKKQRETCFPTNQLVKILEDSQTIKDGDCQDNAIRHLLAQLPLSYPYKVLQQIELLEEDKSLDGKYYLALTPNLKKNLRQAIDETTEFFQNLSQTLALSISSQHLSSNQIRNILKELKIIYDEGYKAEVLSVLASRLPLAQLDKILKEIQILGNEPLKAEVLSKLAFRLVSDKPHDQLHEKHKAQVISILEPLGDQVDKTLQQILDKTLQEIQANQKLSKAKIFALSAIVPHLALNQIPDVLMVTKKIEVNLYRADILRVLAPVLVRFSPVQLHDLWSEMLPILAGRDRIALLSDFRELTPVISKLGTDEAIAELCHVIKDIGRQFP